MLLHVSNVCCTLFVIIIKGSYICTCYYMCVMFVSFYLLLLSETISYFFFWTANFITFIIIIQLFFFTLLFYYFLLFFHHFSVSGFSDKACLLMETVVRTLFSPLLYLAIEAVERQREILKR